MAKTAAKTSLAHDDVIVLHSFFIDTTQKHFATYPELIKSEITELGNRFTAFHDIYYGKKNHTIDKQSTAAEKKSWSDSADMMIKKAYHTILAEGGEDIVKVYFGTTTPSSAKKATEKLLLIEQLLNTSVRETRNELNNMKQNLDAIRNSGKTLLEQHNSTVHSIKNDVAVINDKKNHWKSQYSKMKLYMKAYYYESSQSYEHFFKDSMKSEKSKKSAETPAESSKTK